MRRSHFIVAALALACIGISGCGDPEIGPLPPKDPAKPKVTKPVAKPAEVKPAETKPAEAKPETPPAP